MNRPFNDQRFYDRVSSELRNKEIHDGLWVKALGKAQGDKKRAEGIYIELRVEFLIDEAQVEINEEINFEKDRRAHEEETHRKNKLIEQVDTYQRHEDTDYPFNWFVFVTFLIFPIITIVYFFVKGAFKWGFITIGLVMLLGIFMTIINMSATLSLSPWIVLIVISGYVSNRLGANANYIVAESRGPVKAAIRAIDSLDDLERNEIFSEYDKHH